MKTIHIKNYIPLLEGNRVYTSDVPKLRSLVKEIYEYTLINDPKFHFFFEPEIILRIDSKECLNKAKEFLQAKSVIYEEYDYPFPENGFGEDKNSIVGKNLELFISVFHNNSVAALIMDEKDHFDYLERLFHTAFNPKFYSPQEEGENLKLLAELKLGKSLV